MFCPRCGQQAAEEVRFCSRCGLALDAAAELVETGGNAAISRAETDAAPTLTPRQRGTRKGLMIIAGGILFFVLVAILNTIKDDFFPVLILAGMVITAGVMRLLYGLMLEEHRPEKQPAKRALGDAATRRDVLPRSHVEHGAALPPAHTAPASLYTKPGAETSDMAAPSSVTENTTRLLEEDEGGHGRRAV